MMRTQRSVVYDMVRDVMGDDYDPNVECRRYFNSCPTQFAEVVERVYDELRNGTTTLRRSYTDEMLKLYTKGLVSNWLRKDSRLNGGDDKLLWSGGQPEELRHLVKSKQDVCECGAKHTSNPDHHSDYCKLYVKPE